MGTRKTLVIPALADYAPEIAPAMWRLDDARKRTYAALEGMDDLLEVQAAEGAHTPGTLLYHIAAIELDWLVADVLEGQTPDESIWDLFTYDVRDEQGRLTHVSGHHMAWYRERLDRVRDMLRDTYRNMTLADFRRARSLEHYDVTPEWVLHHLAQHEAEHRGELMTLRGLLLRADT